MEDRDIDFEHRLTEVEQRAKSNTIRIDEHDQEIKENNNLIGAIKELATEVKGEIQVVTCSRVSNYCVGFFSRTGGAKVGGDPYYLSEDNLQ